MGRAALLPPTGWVIRPAVVVRTGSHTSGVASGDPGAFIPRGVRVCVSSASSPTYGGAVGCSVTVVHHNFYGFAILFMGGVFGDSSTLLAVS